MPCLISCRISSSNSPDFPILCMPMTYKPSKRESLKMSTRCPVFVSIPITEEVIQHLLLYTLLACFAFIKILLSCGLHCCPELPVHERFIVQDAQLLLLPAKQCYLLLNAHHLAGSIGNPLPQAVFNP